MNRSAADRRDIALSIFLNALRKTDVRRTMAEKVTLAGTHLRAGGLDYNLSAFNRVCVIALGKASEAMCEGLVEALGSHLPFIAFTGIVVGPGPEAPKQPGLVWRPGAHPVPDHGSREAADAILHLLATVDARTLVIFLISGGASAMLEKPLDASISIQDTARFYQVLVHAGLRITDMNVLRKHFSAVKGGRLALQAMRAGAQCSLVISDVPGDDLSSVGSGPTVPDRSTREDCRRILQQSEINHLLPDSVRAFFQSPDLLETPKPHHPAFARSRHVCILSPQDLLTAAAEAAAAAGFQCVIDNTCDDWAYQDAADYLLQQLHQLRKDHPRACLLSGGELSVQVPAQCGTGGRNLQFALYCAQRIAQQEQQVTVLSGGSDGADGNSPAAGAVADETTWRRAQAVGLDPASALSGFDAFPLLARLGAAIVTGPTGTNLRDLRILLSGD